MCISRQFEAHLSFVKFRFEEYDINMVLFKTILLQIEIVGICFLQFIILLLLLLLLFKTDKYAKKLELIHISRLVNELSSGWIFVNLESLCWLTDLFIYRYESI